MAPAIIAFFHNLVRSIFMAVALLLIVELLDDRELLEPLSHRQVVADHLGIQLRAFALGFHRAFGHDDVFFRQSGGKMEALLHQQNREPARLLKPDDHVLNLIDDGGLNPLRRLIEQQQFGTGEDGAADRQLLLFPAA
jgi:hypothetical protein